MRSSMIICLLFALSAYLSNAQGGDPINKYDNNGLKTGKWVYRSTVTGKIAKVEYYVAEKKNGLCIYYDNDGRLQSEIEFRDDVEDGIFKYYSPNGEKIEKEFRKGKQEGMTRLYNKKGVLTEEYEYKNNMANGIHRLYSTKGRVIMETTFVNGSETGTRRNYKDSKRREIISEADYVNDRRIEIRYYKRGVIINTVKDDPTAPQEIIK